MAKVNTTPTTPTQSDLMIKDLENNLVVRPQQLGNLVTQFVLEEDLTDMAKRYDEYVETVLASGHEHAKHHANRMSEATKKTALFTMRKALERVILAELRKGASYIERNAIAKQIGNKVSAKTFKDEHAKYVKANDFSKLSIGLNITEFMRYANYISMSSGKNGEGHTIVKMEANFIIPKKLKRIAAKVRALSCTDEDLKFHTPDVAGGYNHESKTMLNSKGFNSVTRQPEIVCEAINCLQSVEYTLREEMLNDPILNRYKTEPRWFASEDHGGKFMTGEWSKFANDIQSMYGKVVNFARACDDRGRLNSLSTYLALHGDKMQKAMWEFANKQVVTDGNIKYLKIEFANEAFTDKCREQEAIDWFDAQTDEQLDEYADKMVMKPNETGHMVEVYPYPNLRGVLNDYKAAMAGQPVGTIVSWDATNQGAQIYAILAKDIQTALLSNVYDNGERMDAYGILAEHLNRLTGQHHINGTFNRDNVKPAFMTYLYGAGMKKIINGDEYGKETPSDKSVFESLARFFPKELKLDTEAKWNVFIEAMKKLVPAAVRYMELIYKYHDKKRSKYEWIMPDGFKVETTTYETDTIEAHYFKLAHGKEPASTPTGSISVRRETGVFISKALAPNIIHSIDAYIVRELARRLGIEINDIFDSFGVHPNDVDATRQTYKEVLADILDMDLLENILMQINPDLTNLLIRKGKFTKGDLTYSDVLQSTYALR